MPTTIYRDLAERLLPIPTAPFHEHLVCAEVRRFAAERPPLNCEADAFGNLVLTFGPAPPELMLTAHLDHPGLGFVQPDGADCYFERLGGVPTSLTRDAPVLLFGSDSCEPIGRGRVTAYLEDGLPGAPEPRPAFRVRLDEPLSHTPTGVFATWDLPGCRVEGRRLQSRACDDLAGVAVALAVIEESLRQGVEGTGALLTRAEETGFGGMLAALQAGSLPRDAVYVNIECSSTRAGAPLGEGPVIRVGDRRWIFDAGVTGALSTAAEACRAADGRFRYQRRLMDGGTCEATPLSRAGLATGAVALPLDNYHNHGRKALRAEAVDLDDAESLVTLLLQLARSPCARAVDATLRDVDGMLEERRQAHTSRLLRTAMNRSPPPSPEESVP